jgi:light-regulated signal transduction histidine kinase (bacteriophytochrome)
LIDAKKAAEAQAIADELSAKILAEDWKKANELSNQLEAVIVNAAGVDEDNILYGQDPMQGDIDAMITWLNENSTREIFGAVKAWDFESMPVYRAFDNDEQQR